MGGAAGNGRRRVVITGVGMVSPLDREAEPVDGPAPIDL